MPTPPCTRYSPRLFDSTDAWEHNAARTICAACPMVVGCLRLAVSIANESTDVNRRGPDGTWGGLLWRDGRIVEPRGGVVEVAA